MTLDSEVVAGLEVRKVEVYRDGRHDLADRSRSTGSTMLGEQLMPAVEEINEGPEFSAEAISAAEFERVWQQAVREVPVTAGVLVRRAGLG